jgi:hypothetical protein
MLYIIFTDWYCICCCPFPGLALTLAKFLVASGTPALVTLNTLNFFGVGVIPGKWKATNMIPSSFVDIDESTCRLK